MGLEGAVLGGNPGRGEVSLDDDIGRERARSVEIELWG